MIAHPGALIGSESVFFFSRVGSGYVFLLQFSIHVFKRQKCMRHISQNNQSDFSWRSDQDSSQLHPDPQPSFKDVIPPDQGRQQDLGQGGQKEESREARVEFGVLPALNCGVTHPQGSGRSGNFDGNKKNAFLVKV